MLKSMLFFFGLLLAMPRMLSAQQLTIEQKQSAGGIQYTIIYTNGLKADLETRRPDKSAASVHLCVPAAYTDLDSFKPLGLLVHKGIVRSKTGYLPGTLQIINGRIKISRIDRGHHPGDSLLAVVAAAKGTLLQQELLVLDGRNQRTEGGSHFQRRALVEFSDGRIAIIESDRDITMFQFASDLVQLGVKHAYYLDMGNWDEGWYRQGKQVVVIGKRRKTTHRQSNWLIFKQ